jgi:mono/diheme cytochrome c family protein
MIESSFARRTYGAFVAFALVGASYVGAFATATANDAPAGTLLQGKYLVTGAGQCADCHGRTLAGGPNRIKAPPFVPWAKKVPSLRGLAMFKTDADATRFLITAKLPGGRNARRPMPRYNFKPADARAIVAYLRTLK